MYYCDFCKLNHSSSQCFNPANRSHRLDPNMNQKTNMTTLNPNLTGYTDNIPTLEAIIQVMKWAFSCQQDRFVTSDIPFWFDKDRKVIMAQFDGDGVIVMGITLQNVPENICVLVCDGMNIRRGLIIDNQARARAITALKEQVEECRNAPAVIADLRLQLSARTDELAATDKVIESVLRESDINKAAVQKMEVDLRYAIDEGTKSYQARNEAQAQVVTFMRQAIDQQAEKRAFRVTIADLSANPLAAMIRERDDTIGVLSNEMNTLKLQAQRLADLNKAVTEYLTMIDDRHVNTVDQEAARHTVQFLLSPAYVLKRG